jgi:flavin-dependent dehydrogenase
VSRVTGTARDYDVAIVGGGFAGLACAQAAACRGLRAVVLERKSDPGASPRTTGILVKELADEWDVPRSLTRKVHGVRLYSPSLRSIDLESPGYYFLATDTPALLRWLSAQAEGGGAEVRTGVEYRGARRHGTRISLVGLETACRWLVGADGVRSRVAREFGLGLNRKLLVGVEAEYEGVGGVDEDRLHCFLDPVLAPGYMAWVVPGAGVTQVGLAARWPARPRIEPFVERLRSLYDFGRARVIGRRGGLIPAGGTVRPFGAGNVLLAGDAAGLVSPLTAGGIHTAYHYGRRAGQLIADHVLDAGPDPVDVLRGVYPSFTWKKLLRAAVERGTPGWAIDLLLASPPLRALARLVFFHHRGLFSPAAWRALARAPVAAR